MQKLINFTRMHNMLNKSLDNINLARDLCANPDVTQEHKQECVEYLNNSLVYLNKGVYLLN